MIFHDNSAYLLYLVWFCLVSLRLKIDDLLNAALGENVVIATYAFRET